MRVGFKWGDSFNPNKKSTQSTLLFERACVLYNLGAHESRSASEEDRSTEAVSFLYLTPREGGVVVVVDICLAGAKPAVSPPA